jgi:hypothetical protein
MRNLEILSLCSCLLTVSCSQSTQQENNQTNSQDSVQVITADKLQGYWTCKERERDYTNVRDGRTRDGATVSIRANINWLIQGDSVWIFQYPCEFITAGVFKIKGDSLYLNNNTNASAHITYDENLIRLTAPGNINTPVETSTFTRDTFDLAIVEMLKRDTVNMECLTGRMRKVTKLYPIDEAPYDLTLPVSLPDHLEITSTDKARKLYKDKTIMLPVNGQDRIFRVTSIEWNNLGNEYNNPPEEHWDKTIITLSPADWWTGEPFEAWYEEE